LPHPAPFLSIENELSAPLQEEVAATISSSLQTLFPGDPSLDAFNTSFLQQSPTTAARLLAAARAMVIMKHPASEIEELVFQMLADEAGPTISVSVNR
jgi:hypothetical protein